MIVCPLLSAPTSYQREHPWISRETSFCITPQAASGRPLTTPKCSPDAPPVARSSRRVGDNKYHVVLELGLAAVKGTYDGHIVITDQVPGTSYHMSVSGEGLTGFVRGDGNVSLASEGDNTRLSYEVDAQVGGPVAGVGQRVMGGISKMMVGQFFLQAGERVGRQCLTRRLTDLTADQRHREGLG